MLANRRVWLGAAVTAGFLLLLFLRIDFAEMRTALVTANYTYLVPAIAIYFVSLYFRSSRWRYLLRPFAAIETRRLYPVVIVGYMANNLLPMRIGELARSYFLSTREPVRGSTALATVVVERVFDGLVMFLFLAVGAFFLPVTGLAGRISEFVGIPEWGVGILVIAPFATVLGLIIVIALYPNSFRGFAQSLGRRLPERIGLPAYGLAERFIAGFAGLHRPQRLAAVLLLSLPIWTAEAVMYYIVALGFGLQAHLGGLASMMAGMLVFTAVANLATSIPSSQGSVGPFEFFSTIALVFLGAGSGLASAYAIVLHAALLLPVIVAGLVYLASQSLTLGQLAKVPQRREPVPAGAGRDFERHHLEQE
ncbi:MAG: lysylphosphatidylglycerol synthase transmembrane domain-containing protein, partial [Dehalococcoidia bacterium]